MLEFKDYYNKVLGCYMGKNIGGTLGAPFECYRGEYDISGFMQNMSEPIPNDDIDLQLVWLRAAENEGRKIDSHVLAEYWNTYISATLSEYGTGKNNFNMGIAPPMSGYMRNVNRNSNGAWIRTEIWACLCAGNPALAVNYAYYDSCVDHSDEGVYSAAFCAAVQSAAFFESDVNKLIEIGLSYIPETCAVTKAVRRAVKCFNEGKSWQQARKELFKDVPSSFGMICGHWQGTAEVPACKECPVQSKDPEIPDAEHGFDAPWSVGTIVMSLLYGKGDFGKSICIAVNCGEDTDCTAGTVGAILGIINGADSLPADWVNACSDKIAVWTLRIDQYLKLPKTVRELADRVVRVAPEFLGVYNCELLPGFSENADSESYFAIKPTNSLYYAANCFDPVFQEDAKELLSEQGRVVRRHFMLYNVLIDYGEDLAKLSAGKEKTLKIKFLNRLYTPQYLTVRFLEVPEDWNVEGGKERCVGLEHWHGSTNDNSIEFKFTPQSLCKGSYTVIMEIYTNGRMTKNYIPLTFINGAC